MGVLFIFRLCCHIPQDKYKTVCFVARSCPTCRNPMDFAQAPLSTGFSRQEYWSGLPFPSPGDLPHPGIEPGSPALQADALPSELLGKAKIQDLACNKCSVMICQTASFVI